MFALIRMGDHEIIDLNASGRAFMRASIDYFTDSGPKGGLEFAVVFEHPGTESVESPLTWCESVVMPRNKGKIGTPVLKHKTCSLWNYP